MLSQKEMLERAKIHLFHETILKNGDSDLSNLFRLRKEPTCLSGLRFFTQ